MPTTEELIRGDFGFGADPMAAPVPATSGPLNLPPEPAMKRGRSYDRWLQKRDRAIQDQQLERQDRRDSMAEESEQWRRNLAEERAAIDREQFRLQMTGAERAAEEYKLRAKEKADTNEQVTQAMRSLATANDMSSLDAAEDTILSAFPLAAQDSSVRAMIENKRNRFAPTDTGRQDKRLDPNTALLDLIQGGGLVGPDGKVTDRKNKEVGNIFTDGQIDPFKARQALAALGQEDKPEPVRPASGLSDSQTETIIKAVSELDAAKALAAEPDLLDAQLDERKGAVARAQATVDKYRDQYGSDPRTASLFGDKPAEQSPAPTEIPDLTSKAEFDALPSGATYRRNGKLYRKP